GYRYAIPPAMKLDIQYDPSLDSLIINASGDIGFSDLPKINQSVLEHESFYPNVGQILDCSNGSLTISFDELKRFIPASRQIAKVFGEKRKLALVNSKPEDFGRMRQYQALLNLDPNIEILVFRSMEQAREWIKG